MKRSPWFPVWADFQDDDDFLAVSAEAELLYLRGLARCKKLDQGTHGGFIGRAQLRRLCDKMSAPPEELAAELADQGLWEATPSGWRVPAYGEWNRSAAEDRVVRANRARVANHTRWGHPGPLDACPKCNRQPELSDGSSPELSTDPSGVLAESQRNPSGVRPDPSQTNGRADHVFPGESDRTPSGVLTESLTSPKVSLDVDIDIDRENPPYPPVRTDQAGEPEPVAVEVVGLADRIIETLGMVDAIANEGERHLVARALARGHTETDLLAAGWAVAARDDIDRPRAYLARVLTRMANEPPANTPAKPASERRPNLDDERSPCGTCGASGWIDHWAPDGTHAGVGRCPECDPEVAVA